MSHIRLVLGRRAAARRPATSTLTRRLVGANLPGWLSAFLILLCACATTAAQAAGVISSAAGITIPTAVALDASGNLYVSSQNRVFKVDRSGAITAIAGTGTYAYGGDGGPATAASFTNAFGLAVDAAGNVYVADNGNNRVRKVTASGVISTIAGTGAAGFSGDGGPATAATLKAPSGVAVDGGGNVYFVDTLNYRVRKIDSAGRISTVAGTGVNGYSGDGGQATAAAISEAYGVAVDVAGNLYLADSLGNRIRKVGASGTISTIAGNGVKGYAGDGGPATAANLGNPVSVAVDGAGNVLIADQDNLRIRMVDAAGAISTVAGNGTAAYSGDGGSATSAGLSYPSAVAANSPGIFFIADSNNNRIRKVVTATDIVGGWVSTNVGDVFTFTAEGKYYHAEDQTNDQSGWPGMEFGTYSWNPATGAFSSVTTVDTNGDVGLSNSACSKAVVSGNTMTLSCGSASTPNIFTLLRVTSTASAMVGSWFAGTATSNRIFTFLSDGNWFSAANEDPVLDPSGQKGMEHGTYTWNSSTGAFSHTIISNTDRQWGLSNSICNKAVVSGATLTLTCADTSTPTVFNSFTTSRVAAPAAPTTPASPGTPAAPAIDPSQPVPPPPTTQTAYTASVGRMPAEAVTTTATGTLGSVNLSVSLDLSKVLSGGSFAGLGQFAAGYNVYVVALVPGAALGASAPMLFVLPESRTWAVLGAPIAAFMTGVAQGAANQTVQINILQSTNMTSLLGTEFYVGYGLDDNEMLVSRRYRGVYKVQ